MRAGHFAGFVFGALIAAVIFEGRVRREEARADLLMQRLEAEVLAHAEARREGDALRVSATNTSRVQDSEDCEQEYDGPGDASESATHRREGAVRIGYITAEPRIDGVVLGVSDRTDLVLISVGEKDRARVGYRFTVYRGSEYVSALVVQRVEDDWAACNELVDFRCDTIQQGDNVSTKAELDLELRRRAAAALNEKFENLSRDYTALVAPHSSGLHVQNPSQDRDVERQVQDIVDSFVDLPPGEALNQGIDYRDPQEPESRSSHLGLIEAQNPVQALETDLSNRNENLIRQLLEEQRAAEFKDLLIEAVRSRESSREKVDRALALHVSDSVVREAREALPPGALDELLEDAMVRRSGGVPAR
jgi:hypothetical protein